ncbi:MAG: hypothetical protein H7A24_17630 [Leptospiraceae bacterium]|nr:hypothetical protein [Leptospiraceae bacterium]MCP5513715.1 hypothetical protein [Leptospiraceae bacterium]
MIFVGLLLISVAVYLQEVAQKNLETGRRERKFLPVSAKVLHVHTIKPKPESYFVSLKVDYYFSVKGESISGSIIPNTQKLTKDYAPIYIEKYFKNRFTLYYNPNQTSEVLLKPMGIWDMYLVRSLQILLVIMGIFNLGVGVYFFYDDV